MKQSYTYRGLRRELRRKEQTGTGFRTVPAGHEIVDVELTVDFDAIVGQIGIRAAKNKSGNAKFMSGAIIVKVIRRVRGEALI